MNYCNCKKPEPEEVERGVVYCMNCELEMERHEDAPEPSPEDYDRDITPDEALQIDLDR